MRIARWIICLGLLCLASQALAQVSAHAKRLVSGWTVFGTEALVVPANGLPVLGVFRDVSGTRTLAFYLCADAVCETGTVAEIVRGPVASFANGMSVVLSGPALPAAAFVQDDEVKWVRCVSAPCTLSRTVRIGAAGTPMVRVAAVADSAGLARLAFVSSIGRLSLVSCADLDCTSRTTAELTRDVHSTNFAVALGPLDAPRVLYHRSPGGLALNLIACVDPGCLSPRNETALSLAIGSTLMPLGRVKLVVQAASDYAHFSYTTGEQGPFVSLASVVSGSCEISACAASVRYQQHAAQEYPAGTSMPTESALKLGRDDLPLIAYFGGLTDRSMYVVHGRPRDFVNQDGRRTVVDPHAAANPALSVRPDGLPVLAYATGGGTFVVSCATRTCS